MQGIDIVNKAMELKNMVYWYGGKRQKCTEKLLQQLKKENPKMYTENYIRKCREDIKNGKYCCDCSGLVCYAYGISDIGSYAIRERFKVWNGSPRPGMIGWKSGHVGIIKTCSGKVIEMRGIDYDFQDTRYRKVAGLMTLLYEPNIEY